MIVDVDCTAAGEETCHSQGVKGYPTIKYFLAGNKNGKDYQGGRDFDSLKNFVESTLNKPVCNVKTKKGCKDNEIKYIEKNEGKTLEELQEELKTKEEDGKNLKKELQELQKKHKEEEKELKKKEKGHTMAKAILKQLVTQAEKAAKA